MGWKEDVVREQEWVGHNMLKNTGGFLRSLGKTILSADGRTAMKLKKVFSTEWEFYK